MQVFLCIHIYQHKVSIIIYATSTRMNIVSGYTVA